MCPFSIKGEPSACQKNSLHCTTPIVGFIHVVYCTSSIADRFCIFKLLGRKPSPRIIRILNKNFNQPHPYICTEMLLRIFPIFCNNLQHSLSEKHCCFLVPTHPQISKIIIPSPGILYFKMGQGPYIQYFQLVPIS